MHGSTFGQIRLGDSLNTEPDFKPMASRQSPSYGKDLNENYKHFDLLTLKKQVIEEIKGELEIGQGKGLFPGISKPGYVDPFSRLDQRQNQREGDKVAIKGKGKPTITLDENENEDELNEANKLVIEGERKAQAEVDVMFGKDRGSMEDVRKSV